MRGCPAQRSARPSWSASSFPPPRVELLAPHARPAQWFGGVARQPVCLSSYFCLQISIFGGVNFFHTVVEGQTNYLTLYPGSTVRCPLGVDILLPSQNPYPVMGIV